MTDEELAAYLVECLAGKQPMIAIMSLMGKTITVGRDGQLWDLTITRRYRGRHERPVNPSDIPHQAGHISLLKQ